MTPKAKPASRGELVLLLPTSDQLAGLDVEALARVLVQLTTAAAAVSARLAVAPPRQPPPLEPDDLLTIEAVAKLTRRSVSWLHTHGHELPGFNQHHGKGGRKFWSRRALLAWMAGEGAA